jgi:hypothetical protein
VTTASAARVLAAASLPMFALAAFTLGAPPASVAAAASRAPPVEADAASAQAARGAAIYTFWCASCHGPTGQGLAEAVASFPEGHRACTSCHHPGNAAQMPGSQVGLATMAFSLGDPPPLAAPGSLTRFGSAAGLYGYVRAAMPRWSPASLDDQAYLDVTAHLLRLVGALGADDVLTVETLEERSLE